MERQEAQGSSQGPARPGTPTALKRLGSRKLGAKAGRSQGWPKGADRKAPGASRRSIPLVGGETEKGTKGPTRGRTTTSRGDDARPHGGTRNNGDECCALAPF